MKIYYDPYEIEEKYCYNLRFVDDLYKNHFTLDILIRNYKESEFKELKENLNIIIKNLFNDKKIMELKIDINNLISKCVCIYNTSSNDKRIVFDRNDCPNHAIDIRYYVNSNIMYKNELRQKDFLYSIIELLPNIKIK